VKDAATDALAGHFGEEVLYRIEPGGLQSAINAYLAEHNANPKPFVWTQSANTILAKLDRVPVLSECV
jgi:hypothetical protein